MSKTIQLKINGEDVYPIIDLNKLKWKYLGSPGLGQHVKLNLPEEWNELLVYVQPGNDSMQGMYMMAIINHDFLNLAPKDKENKNSWVFGLSSIAITGSSSGTTVQGGNIRIFDDNTIAINYIPGWTNSSKMWVYYR